MNKKALLHLFNGSLVKSSPWFWTLAYCEMIACQTLLKFQMI